MVQKVFEILSPVNFDNTQPKNQMQKTKSTVENEIEDDMIFGILNKPIDFKPS